MTPRRPLRSSVLQTAGSMAATALIALFLAAPVPAQAACERSKRISHRDANCLTARWTNRTWPNSTEVHVKSECSSYGKVVAKIDIKHAADITWHLNYGDWRSRHGFFRVREISCCSDLSDFCNTSGLVTDQSCLERFRTSSADETCRDVTATAHNTQVCKITARCMRKYDFWRRSSITATYRAVAGLHNCNGYLTRGACPP